MKHVLEPSDECPHCRLPLEILSAKVGPRGTAIVWACMNCAMTRTENPKQARRAPFRRVGGDRARFGQHPSSEGFQREASAPDAHDPFEGPKRTIGIVAQAKGV
jgi:hypothetical protein